jgi:ribosomal protein S21
MREYKRGVKVVDGKVEQALRKFKKKIQLIHYIKKTM